jgi:hypothetical protein
MNGKQAAAKASGKAQGAKARGLFNIEKFQEETVKKPDPPPNEIPQKEYKNPKPQLPHYTIDEPTIRNATMLENGNPLSGTINTKLCILFLILTVVLLSALTITVLVVGRHPSHSNLKPGAIGPAGFIANGPNDLVYDITEGGTKRRELLTYYYDMVLGDEVQQWQSFPKDDVQLPDVNSSLHKISSYDVCCYSDQQMWICSNGHTFDPYAFEARLRSVSESIGGVQCLIYINSRHLARSQCTLEIRMRS